MNARVRLLRLEIDRVGADEFVRSRVMREDMPLKLMRHLQAAPLVDELTIDRAKGKGRPTLTRRRLDMLAMVADGLLDKQIAVRCEVTVTTVKSHLRAVYAVLGARNRAHAVHIAHRDGLL